MVFTNLETDRLFLENIEIGDREFIFDHFADPVVSRYLFDAEPMGEISEADMLINFYTCPEPRTQHRWIIKRKSDGSRIGTCGFHCWNMQDSKVDVGYDLKREFWGHGYMHEAMKEIIKFAKHNMQVKEILACIYLENEGSIKLVQKLDFTLAGRSTEVFRGKEYVHKLYSLIL